MLLALLLTATMLGCGKHGPTERYFNRQPIRHWLEEIRNSDPKARKKAADVLGNAGLSDRAAIPALAGALKDEDAGVRDAAVLALSKLGPAAASAARDLEELLEDEDGVVRSHAATALERVRAPK